MSSGRAAYGILRPIVRIRTRSPVRLPPGRDRDIGRAQKQAGSAPITPTNPPPSPSTSLRPKLKKHGTKYASAFTTFDRAIPTPTAVCSTQQLSPWKGGEACAPVRPCGFTQCSCARESRIPSMHSGQRRASRPQNFHRSASLTTGPCCRPRIQAGHSLQLTGMSR